MHARRKRLPTKSRLRVRGTQAPHAHCRRRTRLRRRRRIRKTRSYLRGTRGGQVRNFAQHAGPRNLGFRAFHQFQARLERIAQRLRARKNRRRSPRRDEPRHLPATRRPGDPVKSAKALFIIAVLALPMSLSPTASSQVPSGRDVVKPETYVSLDPAGRGSSFQIAVVMKIRPGFHVNAREKSEDYLIATHLKAALPPGFNTRGVSHPHGKPPKIPPSQIPFEVAQRTSILRIPVSPLESTP